MFMKINLFIKIKYENVFEIFLKTSNEFNMEINIKLRKAYVCDADDIFYRKCHRVTGSDIE